jgi:hypothetical protein
LRITGYSCSFSSTARYSVSPNASALRLPYRS